MQQIPFPVIGLTIILSNYCSFFVLIIMQQMAFFFSAVLFGKVSCQP